MPAVNAVQTSGVHAAIQRASAATGVDFDYLLAQARLESGLNPDARARTSSAAGLYQFVDGTWLETVDRHGSVHGLGWADEAISRNAGRATVADPAMRAQVMALRHDPDAAALMAAELARDNSAALQGVLGREPDATELYLAHFLGAGGAGEFLAALQSDPGQSSAALFPRPASSNRAIFFEGGRARSLGEVMEVMRGKVANAMAGGAMQGGTFGGAAAPATVGGAFQQAASRFGLHASAAGEQPTPAAARPSMADTLRATFAAGPGPGAGGSRIDEAYAKFRSFGL